MRTRTFLLAALAILVAGAVAWRWAPHGRPAFDSPAVITQIQRLSELVTVRYSVQQVVGLTEQKTPFGEESILLMVQGEARAGIDLQKIAARDVELGPDATVMIALPAAKLTAVYLDEKRTKVWDRHVTWWTPWVPYSADLEHKARLQAIEDVRAAALQMGIVGQAQRNAEASIRDLLGAMGFKVSYRSGD